ncbi:MAG: threonine synthase [Planctomycetes bacterium]|nr:threonine synthase [Planctomycetota bacterium]
MTGPCPWRFKCVVCDTLYRGTEVRYRCDCGETLDVVTTLAAEGGRLEVGHFDQRLASKHPADRSGVWRFRELVLPLPPDEVVTREEGNTPLYDGAALRDFTGVPWLRLKHEGENPTGSFKDRGMTVAVSIAKRHGFERIACASTGNTSASMAAYAAQAGMRAYVFIPDGKIAYGKLSQALAYGARTIQIPGDFDAAMRLVEEVCEAEGIYLVNSINPFRVEGQKAIALEMLQQLDWDAPDWIVLPGGNLGNNTALSKALAEVDALGFLQRMPRLAVIQAEGANPLYRAWKDGGDVQPVAADTLASAIRIGNPVSWRKSLRGLRSTMGVVEQVSDQEIMDAKARVDAIGIGAEPASCATVAGIRKLTAAGVIGEDERVCGVLTGHLLKDPDAVVNYHQNRLDGITSHDANAPRKSDGTLDDVRRLLDR